MPRKKVIKSSKKKNNLKKEYVNPYQAVSHNKHGEDIGFLKQYAIFLIPVGLLILYALFGRGNTTVGGMIQNTVLFIAEFWAEILFITLFIAVAILVVMRIYSKIVIMQLQKEHEDRREKSKIHKMRFGVRRDY
ncbi:MAG: hypothetical protein ACMXYE_04660 [Candidatus Woesearchaeota archaeon]